MTKKEIIDSLQDFHDDDILSLGEFTHLYELKPRKICGGFQHGMVYFCVKEPNHSGACYCANKDVYFTPDTIPFEEWMSGDYNDE